MKENIIPLVLDNKKNNQLTVSQLFIVFL